jgi:hypothetical protein
MAASPVITGARCWIGHAIAPSHTAPASHAASRSRSPCWDAHPVDEVDSPRQPDRRNEIAALSFGICPTGEVGRPRAPSSPVQTIPTPLAATMRADHTGVSDNLRSRDRGATAAASTTRCGPKQQRGTDVRFRRNGAVRARCLAWLLRRRTDSHAWRGDLASMIGSMLTFVEVGGNHAGQRLA